MNRERKNKIKAIAGSIIFHALLLVALLFLALTTPLPLPGEEGVEVNLGSSDVGMGRIQDETPAPRTPPPAAVQPPAPQEEKVKEDIITQEVEEAPAIEEKKEEEKVKVEEKPIEPEKTEEQPEDKPVDTPTEQPAEPEPEVQKVDPRALYPGKSSSGTGQDEGITGQPGDQGKPNGDPGSQNYDGQGGAGNGVSFSLGGRGSRHLPKPSYQSQEQGKVVVDIWVNREGKVVKALAGAKGTTILDIRLRRVAEEAALRSLFEPDPNAPDNQKGTITYIFIRQN